MKKSLFNLFLFCALFSQAQNPLVKVWDKRFGGTYGDWLTSFQQTNDKGYILGGWSNSTISGDKTQDTIGSVDYWIVKLDSNGNKLWDKDFGGTDLDYLHSVQQTKDGGYILGGESYSGIGGDKTEPIWYHQDYWIIKIDSLGNKQWDKDFGGTGEDWFQCLEQTIDGGYLLAGYTNSGISGDKTQSCWGNSCTDFWIIKIDSLGNKLWDHDYGGTGWDKLYSIKRTLDGGFLLGGWSSSAIGGDKSQAQIGGEDYWIIKIDSQGNKEWDKVFGGTDADWLSCSFQTLDKGFILCGWSQSPIGGDKSQDLCLTGTADYWIIKIDSLGAKEWDKDLGSTNWENDIGGAIQNSNHEFVIAGNSDSPISCDKTENNLGVSQPWIVKTDSLGNLKWEKTILTQPDQKTIPFILQANDGCYLIAKPTFGGTGGWKSQSNWDVTNSSTDFWILKFCELHPITSFTAIQNFCPGTCTDFLNLSVNASYYQWSFPGAIPDTSSDINPANICYTNPGIYDVQLIASNANGSDTLLLNDYITVYPFPSPQSITQTGDTLFAITGSATYQWYYNGSMINGATDYVYIATQSGNYNVVATDLNGCEVEAAINNVIAESNQFIVGSEASGQFAIYPNPVSETFNIVGYNLSGAANEILIYNLMGEKIHSAVCREQITVRCEDFPPGIYWLELSWAEKTYRIKFIKQ